MSPARAVILQHQDDAPAGLLLDVLRERGIAWQTVHLGRGEPLPAHDAAELAVSLGADTAADDDAREWVLTERRWLRAAGAAGAAILGLCFGAQALACALGGGVARAALPERGWIHVQTNEPELVAPGPWLAWHDDVVELPPGAELIARNPSGPQAFRHGRHLGLQFHPEVTREIVAGWVLGSRDSEPGNAAMLQGTEPAFAAAQAQARRLFAAFIDSVSPGSRW